MVWEGDVFVACLHWWAVRELLDVVTAGVEEVKGGEKKKKTKHFISFSYGQDISVLFPSSK